MPARSLVRHALLVSIAAAAVAAACSRSPKISDDAYRQAVTAFYVSLAALQTSQDALARSELERVTQLAPAEPAAWANLGLLLLRQQQTDEAAPRLAKAYELAPSHAPIVRLLALNESRQGNIAASIGHWRRAMALDPSDLDAPYALALELERQGGVDAEAQALLATLAARSGNLAALIESARLAAKRGDAAALRPAIAALAARSSPWPDDAKARLQAVEKAAAGDPSSAATSIVFLKNVLIREPEYRAALAAVSTPRAEVGEPLTRLVALQNPPPQAAPPDDKITFVVESAATAVAGGRAIATWLTGDGPPVLVTVGASELRLPGGAVLPCATGAAGPLDSVVAADLNYDFRTDLVCAGDSGLRIFRQDENGGFADVSAAARLPPDVMTAPLAGAWTADIDTDGDLDLVVARRGAAGQVLRNNGDGSFAVQAPFGAGSSTPLRGFAWADVDGDGVPDAAMLDGTGRIRVLQNLRGGFREQALPAGIPPALAIAAADVSGDGLVDILALAADGRVARLSWQPDRLALAAADVVRIEPPPGLTLDTARLLAADVDNNGALDLIASGPTQSRLALAAANGVFRALPAPIAVAVTGAADLDGNGRLELAGFSAEGPRVVRSTGTRAYHWQLVRPRAATATGDQRINSFGIGGEIEVRTGLHAQKQIIAAPAVHFGLGEATSVDVARIAWPNGILQSEFGLTADAAVPASQRLKGSCPWLFAWNGREMAFVTDFIWRSPLGLRINAQATADVLMTEDWVRIRGDQLAPRNGEYDLRITAELWETHFFDLVSLLVADHPEGTEAFVDERFAVPGPTPGVVVTRPLQPFAAVRDDSGGDVAAVVAARDDRHLDFAGRGAYQGVTREHFVEIELPEQAPRSRAALAGGTGLGASDRQLDQRRAGAGAARSAAGTDSARRRSPGALLGREVGARLSIGQGQDRADRSRRGLPGRRAAAAPAQHQSRDLLGPSRMGGGTAGCEGRADPPRSQARRSPVSRLLADDSEGCEYAGTPALCRRRRGAALARSRRLPHPLRRRPRAAARRRRPLRHHERRRRDPAGVSRGAAAGGRHGPRLRPGRRRLGEGWRLQHHRVAHGAAAADARVGQVCRGHRPARGRCGLPPPSRRFRALPYPLRPAGAGAGRTSR